MTATKQHENTTVRLLKPIGLYARVSTARQEEEQTIQTQLVMLREFAQKHDYRIVEEYIDDGWSGDILARPALDKLRQDAQEKLWEGVLIYDPDRLARRYSYQELVSDELREAGVELIFVTMPAPKNSEDKILHGVRGLFAEYERAKIAERFRLGKLRKIKEGHILVSEPLYGYRYIPKEEGRHGYYEVNPEEARVVKMIFSWIADERVTLRKVVRRLQESGIRPRKSKRGVWATSTLSHLLRNKAYIGEAHWGSSYAVVPANPINKEKYRKNRKSSRKMKPEEEWHTVAVPTIIDSGLFGRARAQLDANFALAQRNRKNQYLLAGKIGCVCGNRRSGEGVLNGKHLYYRCNDRVRCFPLPPVCKETAVNARLADELVWAKIAALMSSPELLSRQVERWMSAHRTKPESAVADMEALVKEVAKLKKEEERYSKAYGAGLFSVEELKEYVVPIRERVRALEAQIQGSEKSRAEAHRSNMNAALSHAEVAAFTQRASVALHRLSFAAKREIVLNTVDKVVGTKQQLQVHGYIPLGNHVELFTNDRHGVNTNPPDYVEFKTNHRHGVNTIRHDASAKLIPFVFTVPLPPPRLERTIVSRNRQGRILRSIVPAPELRKWLNDHQHNNKAGPKTG